MSEENRHLKSINDLLEYNGHPLACVQGRHTRIVKNDEGEFQVLRRQNIDSPNSSYTISIYRGFVEQEAVSNFIESEED